MQNPEANTVPPRLNIYYNDKIKVMIDLIFGSVSKMDRFNSTDKVIGEGLGAMLKLNGGFLPERQIQSYMEGFWGKEKTSSLLNVFLNDEIIYLAKNNQLAVKSIE